MTQAEIARELGISRQAVSAAIKRRDIKNAKKAIVNVA
ncbi:MarR family transcriptional regulator [Gluconobacter oxydans]